jgi:hypothetical protein
MEGENTMFRHQLIATCFVITGLGSTSAVAASTTARGRETVEVTNLQPFTHIAYIPVGADLSSIKIEGVKAVNVATKLRSVNTRYCEERVMAEPPASLDCPRTTAESFVPAYQVSYSLKGQPMASDEYGNTNFNFSVYFRLDEFSPEARRALSSGRISRTGAAEFFQLTISRDPVQQIAIDQANSTVCAGTYIDGNWTRTNPKCEDKVAYKMVVSAPPYITVKVDPNRRSPRNSQGWETARMTVDSVRSPAAPEAPGFTLQSAVVPPARKPF